MKMKKQRKNGNIANERKEERAEEIKEAEKGDEMIK